MNVERTTEMNSKINISEKKKEAIMMIKIYDQLMKFKLKKKFGDNANED